jgi:hypothetical protein
MIPVIMQVEPTEFSNRVRRPGRAFLRRNPPPTTIQIRKKNFWRFSHDDLYYLHNGICAYSAQWTPRTKNPVDMEHSSVDHYVPISADHSLAYEWSNYRLARARLNHNKASGNVMDPFVIQPDWFVLDFRTFLIKPNDGLSPALENDVEATINQLDLNHGDFVQERIGILQEYAEDPPNGIPFSFLESHYPFMAYELGRQGEVDRIRTRMRPR